MKITINVNGKTHVVKIEPAEMLLDTLRRLGYKSVHRSCDSASCSACTVLLDSNPVLSCCVFAATADGRSIETVEGLTSSEKLHPIQKAFLEEGASQCGYCIPSLVMTTKALLAEEPDPTESEIREMLVGNICRCTGYEAQTRAVRKASRYLRGDEE